MYSPTVFNFYDPLYSPDGPIANTGLIAPEAQIATGPFIINFLNDAGTLIRSGKWQGDLTYNPRNPTDGASIVDELDLLLTSGRLTRQNRDVILARFAQSIGPTAAEEQKALKEAQELLLFTAEFHVTNLNTQANVPRYVPPPTPSAGRAYKALVYIFLNGGADTYNILVPHSNCGGNDLYAEYTAARGINAIPQASLLQIPAASQPCATFGVHYELTALKDAYDSGDAAFVANIGALVQPITRAGVRAGEPKPPSLYSHNTQATIAQNVHAQAAASAKGVLGRIGTVLGDAQPSGEPPYKMKAYSIAGNTKVLEGSRTPPEMLSRSGVVRLSRLAELQADIGATAPQRHTGRFHLEAAARCHPGAAAEAAARARCMRDSLP